MSQCRTCHAEIPPTARFCLACGAPVNSDDSATVTALTPAAARVTESAQRGGRSDQASHTGHAGHAGHLRGSAPTGWGTVVVEEGSFAPGSIIADRYRVVARLGKGGMGEVFRADDLKVGQAVALKFLPRAMSENAGWLERFRGEVRIARQVAHPNVCRVYDLGEASTPEGRRTFLSMEYIDGEDMASLLRRIGRLPKDKAVQVARQIGAGLAAAHAQGVIHRDLKPANIMLDGRGHARITDFGIAGLVDRIGAAEISSGTPAYMAPEQRDGRGVSARSDIYSLGLVLYELFTGRRAFDDAGAMRAGPGDSRISSEISRPSTHAQDLDPVIDRLIMRCLQDDPEARPSSAMAVIAALPGGDPLQAALEAGETPSPELVAAAGERSALRASRVAAMVAAVVVLAVIAAVLGARQSLLNFIDLPRSPAVLADRAAEVLRSIGYTQTPRDTSWGLIVWNEFIHHEAKQARAQSRSDAAAAPGWERLRSARSQPLLFWYRTSPDPLTPWRMNSAVTAMDPPRVTPGMTYVALDSQGRLDALSVVTERVVAERAEPAAGAATPGPGPDWDRLFTLAGLDRSAFVSADPSRTPPQYADTWVAWESRAGEGAEALRVEAASYKDRPVYFNLLQGWEVEAATGPKPLPVGVRVTRALMTSAIVASLSFAAWLSRRNVRQGRGDLPGARRLGWVMFILMFAAWMLHANHIADLQDEWNLIITGMALPLLVGGVSWMLYLALEPFVRRRDPVMLVSWTRLLGGGVNDPAVGRDVLIGIIGGLSLLTAGRVLAELSVLTGEPATPISPNAAALAGWTGALVAVQNSGVNAVLNSMMLVFIFVTILTLTQRRWIAGLVVAAPAALMVSDQIQTGSPWLQSIGAVAGGAAVIAFMLRYGLLATLTGLLIVSGLTQIPVTPDLSAWYGQGSLVGLALLAGLTFWAARAARGGRWSHAAPSSR